MRKSGLLGSATIMVRWLFLLSLLVLGCAPHPLPPPSMVRIQLSAEPISLDPVLAEDGVAMIVLGNTMEGLYGYDSSGKLESRLAESYEVSSDRKRYRFKIRPGARWSDGRKITADDFVLGISRALKEGTRSKLSAFAASVQSAKIQGQDLEIELKYPLSYFLHLLTLAIFFPERSDYLKADSWPEFAPSTGPYKIISHLSGQKIVLEKNEHYWRDNGGPSRAEFLIVQDETTASNLFRQGGIDILTRAAFYELERFKRSGMLMTSPFLATYFLEFNTRRPPFDRVVWRRAVSGSVSRTELCQILGSGEMPASGWVPLGLEGYLPFHHPGLEFADAISMARKLPNSMPIEAAFDSSSRNTLLMERIQQEVFQALGTKISLTSYDWKTFVKFIQSDPPQIFRFGWLAPFHDPISHLQVFVTGNPNNYSGWSNQEYDRLVSEIERIDPGPKREQAIQHAQKILVDEEAVIVPIYHYVQNHVVSKRIAGFRANPFGIFAIRELRLADKFSVNLGEN